MSPSRPRRALLGVVAVLLGWLVVGGLAGPLAGKLTSVQENDNSAFLPDSAESTRAIARQRAFQREDVFPAIVVYRRAGGLTSADRAKAVEDRARFAELPRVLGELSPPIPSRDGEALQLVVPIDATDGLEIVDDVVRMREILGSPGGGDGSAGGLEVHVTGLAGIQADFAEVFGDIDTRLLAVTAVVVIIILLVVYRSPVLWIVPLLSAGLSLTLAQAVVYLCARYAGLTVNGQSQGILTVLVFGAGTDYALLLIARYREELRRHQSQYDAMRVAFRGASPAILASGSTVIVGLLCLLVSQLNSNKSLGPVSAIGIACALAVMLSFLPAVLLLLGRRVFWPFVPRFGSPSHEESGVWGRVARGVGRRPRAAWVAATLVLLALTAGISRLGADGIAQTEAFTRRVDSVVGQEVLARHFAAGSGSPAEIVTNEATGAQVLAVASAVPGVAESAYRTLPTPGAPARDTGGDPRPQVVDGLVQVDATLDDPADSAAAARTVERLRTAVHAVPGADALVGGFTAVDLDVQKASQRDRTVIIPLVLLVIFIVLALLLRALLAPLMLIATVVLSFLATLGVCALVFTYVFDWPGEDSSFPLFAFVFLVALGIDYNIFLMTRVREETLRHGTRAGTLKALAVTGGVITSAGVVLAATFSVLGVLPLVFLAQLGFAVAFGVLLDTLLVRSVLVPALTYDLGSRVWWPGSMARETEQEAPADRPREPAPA